MRTLIATVWLVVSFSRVASGADIVINNGLDCSSPYNVIDDTTYQEDDVYARNAGCPPFGAENPWDPCPSPGVPTAVCLQGSGQEGRGEVRALYAYDSSIVTISGGYVRCNLAAYDSSTVAMSDGSVGNDLNARGFSTVTMSGGDVGGDVLNAGDFSTVTMSGGTVADLWATDFSTVTIGGGTVLLNLFATDSSTMTIAGSDFAVDGSPVPYGDLTAQTGTLTGILASGEPIDNVFYQGGYTEPPCGVTYPCTGTITLVEAPQVPTLSPWSQLVLVVMLIGTELGMWRWRVA